MKQERDDRFVILRFDIMQSKNLSPSEKIVYARICGFKKYFESKEECAEILGISKDTVVKAKQKLVKLGYIKEISNTGRGKIYQSVYDDVSRVVKSTNQSGKKHPIRVAKSTNIEEIENKDRVKSITKVIGETPKEYGNSDINELFKYWEEKIQYKITSKVSANRKSCYNLYKKYGISGVKQLINAVQGAQADRYAPRISDFVELQAKLNQLLLWAKKQTVNTQEVF